MMTLYYIYQFSPSRRINPITTFLTITEVLLWLVVVAALCGKVAAEPAYDYDCLVKCQLKKQTLKTCQPKCPLKKRKPK